MFQVARIDLGHVGKLCWPPWIIDLVALDGYSARAHLLVSEFSSIGYCFALDN